MDHEGLGFAGPQGCGQGIGGFGCQYPERSERRMDCRTADAALDCRATESSVAG